MGGPISSDGGALLLGEVERRRRLSARFAAPFGAALAFW